MKFYKKKRIQFQYLTKIDKCKPNTTVKKSLNYQTGFCQCSLSFERYFRTLMQSEAQVQFNWACEMQEKWNELETAWCVCVCECWRVNIWWNDNAGMTATTTTTTAQYNKATLLTIQRKRKRFIKKLPNHDVGICNCVVWFVICCGPSVGLIIHA